MEAPTIADRQQQVWPLGDYPPPLQLGQVQVLAPDAFVASMQVQQQSEPLQLGFMCGSLPVPTCSPADISDITSSNRNATTEAALIPAISLQSGRAAAPRYRVLPTETDLNTPPPESFESEANFPVSASHEAAAGSCKGWGGVYLGQPVARKCETLAVNALSGYGDDIDVIAPIDILKQIFKTPYSKARISVAVHRIGRTLILNSGPDDWLEERPGGKIGRKKKSSSKSMESSLFSKFVQHSMNGSFCDAESSSHSESQDSQSTSGFEEIVDHDVHSQSRSRMAAQRKGKQRVSLGHHRGRSRVGGGGGRFVGEQQRETEFAETECPSEDRPQRPPSEGFLRVLFWQFQNLRMLLGSDLLLFSNEKHSAVSLHLLEIERQVTPLMWLDAWLDNVMASIPELAICYHRNGVVQGYELLKTDDIFLVKGLAEDGTAFFHPHVVQQNASTVLRFLQDNCKEDPGTYWLLKNSGEDLMQLFDLSVISKPFASCGETEDKDRAALPSSRGCCNGHYSLPLAMLLYRLTNRLARSKDPADRRRCAKLFGKCLEFMDEQEHLTIRASAHEHVARLILSTYEETGSSLKPLLLEASIANATDAVLGLPCSEEEPTSENLLDSRNETEPECDRGGFTINQPEECTVSENGEASNGLSHAEQLSLPSTESAASNVSLVACNAASEYNCVDAVGESQVEETSSAAMEPQKVVRLVPATYSSSKPLRAQADSVSAHLEAVHHISQAIKALRWQRQLQDVGDSYGSQDTLNEPPGHTTQLCICGEADCVAVCDFKEIGIGAQMDQKLWGLMLLLGDAYLALGHAYKDEGLLSRALKATELACQVCGAMPPVRDVTSSWNSFGSSKKSAGVGEDILRQASKAKYFQVKGVDSSKSSDHSESKSKGAQQQVPFWGQLWMFVGDIYVEIQRTLGEGDVTPLEQGSQFEELTMTQEVAKEVKRLKKKIGQLRRSCGICSLTSCSCHSDRASSGNSASSCSSSSSPPKYGRKQMKKSTKSYFSVGSDVVEENHEHSLGTGKSTAGKDSINLPKQFEVLGPTKLTKGSGAKCASPEGKSDPSATNEKFKAEVPESYTPLDIFSFLTRPVTADWESNLSAAVDCYTAAVNAFSGFTECAGNIESCIRKKGWACNELGRKRLAHGQVKSAEASFALAIDSFREVKDLTNIVLVHCNLGHGRRAAAEALASKLPLDDDCDLLTPFVQTIAEAKFLYGEALKYYGSARLELISGGVETISGLWHEVHTQLAHTYLRLGMLLAREDRFVYACRKNTETGRFLGSEDVKERKSGMKDAKSTKDAITKALVLYESLGKFRAQEAAYAQFQLACYHRDSCTRAGAVKQVDTSGLKKSETSIFQKVKLHASLAELYWQKSLDFYKPETHADMFLDILMERSSLCFMMAECLGQHQMAEQAMSFLLEGRKAFKVFEGGERVDNSATKGIHGEWPSKVISDKFISHLQKVLKNMLSAALTLSKSYPSISTVNRNWRNQYQDAGSSGESTSAKASDILKLKDMYRASLQLQGGGNLDQLHKLWVS